MFRRPSAVAPALALAVLLAGCGDDGITDPTDVQLGETTFVFVLNPTVNDANQEDVPPPGPNQGGVDVSIQDGPSGTTGVDGVTVLAPVEAGTRTVSFDDGDGNEGDHSLGIVEQDLREVAVALDRDGAAEMVNVRYAFEGEVIEITRDMSVEDVNDVLSESNDLLVEGSDAGISFSSVVGSLTIDGSDTALLNNAFCGDIEISGSGTVALGNAGMEPVPPPPGGC